MKIYACYSPSHERLVAQHFTHSLPKAGITDRDLELKEFPQDCPTGEFDSAGFQATCLKKVEFILEALAKETEPFIFSDVDVRFYGPVVGDLLNCLGNADMAFQWDGADGARVHGVHGASTNGRCAAVLEAREDADGVAQ